MIYTEKPSRAFSFRSAFTYNSVSRECTLDDSRYQLSQNFDYKYEQIPVDDIQFLEATTEESFASKITRKIIISFCYLAILTSVPISIWFCIKRIHALERLVVFRLGKLKSVAGPGFCFVLPFIDSSIKVDLNPKIYSLPRQQIITADRAIVDILSEIKYCVCNVMCFVTRLHKQEDAIKELVSCCLSNVICGKELSDIENDKNLIASHVKAELNKTVINWGIEILDVSISTVKVLKEAEQINPLTPILDVFKTVTNGSSSQMLSSFMQPFNLNSHAVHSSDANDIHKPLMKFDENDVLINKLKIIANEATKHMSSSKTSTILLFKIMDMDYTRNIFMYFHEGIGDVFENENESYEPNLTLTLSTHVMDDLLDLKISPFQAYAKGDIQISGDFSLLEVFENFSFST